MASEPPNIVLEQLRLLRADMTARFDKIDARFEKMEAQFGRQIADVKSDIQGIKLNTIAEVYKANLTVASFADHERRITALEQKNP